MIGGYLSRPADQYPDTFGSSEFLKKYPYFLPCAVPAIFSAISWLVAFFLLEETVKNPVSIFQLVKNQKNTEGQAVTPDSDKPLSLRSLLTKRVIMAAGNYALLSLIEIAFRAIQPVFLSTPVALGGLDLSPSVIGTLLSISGVLNAIFQVFFSAKVIGHWGTKKTYLVALVFALLSFASFPILSLLVWKGGMSRLVWALVTVHTVVPIGMNMGYGMLVLTSSSGGVAQETVSFTPAGAIFIYVTAASPNRASLGATNGLSQVGYPYKFFEREGTDAWGNQMSVSVFRAIGPAVANSLYSISLAKGYMGGFMVYYVLVVIVFFSIWIGSFLPTQVWAR